MVAQNTLCTCKIYHNIHGTFMVDAVKCLKEIKLPKSRDNCASCSELPSDIMTVNPFAT